MPVIHFIEHNGLHHGIEVAEGVSVMRAAMANGVPRIVGDHGGFLSCATCHVYIDEPWSDLISPPSEQEAIMADCALEVRSTSRLSCQIEMTAQFDGLVVRLPVAQS